MQRDARALLFLDWSDPAVDGIITGKLFEYLFSSTVIWVVGNPRETTAKQLVRDFDAGLILDDRVPGIEQALIAMLSGNGPARSAAPPALLARYGRKELALRMLELAERGTRTRRAGRDPVRGIATGSGRTGRMMFRWLRG
jgi:hypothetical protein